MKHVNINKLIHDGEGAATRRSMEGRLATADAAEVQGESTNAHVGGERRRRRRRRGLKRGMGVWRVGKGKA